MHQNKSAEDSYKHDAFSYANARNVSGAPSTVQNRLKFLCGRQFAMLDQRAVIHAYRHLYRQGLKALHYSVPARYILLRALRSGFRLSSPNEFNQQKIANTERFLQKATDFAGFEHKILKNLMIIRYWEQPQVRKNARV